MWGRRGESPDVRERFGNSVIIRVSDTCDCGMFTHQTSRGVMVSASMAFHSVLAILHECHEGS